MKRLGRLLKQMNLFPVDQKGDQIVVIRWYAIIKDSFGNEKRMLIPKNKAPLRLRFRVNHQIHTAFVDAIGKPLSKFPENAVVEFAMVKKKNFNNKVFCYYQQENMLSFSFHELGIDSIN